MKLYSDREQSGSWRDGSSRESSRRQSPSWAAGEERGRWSAPDSDWRSGGSRRRRGRSPWGLILCALAILAFLLLRPSRAPEPTPTASPVLPPVESVSPTQSPQPTQNPGPTQTPVSTPTPAPTPTPGPAGPVPGGQSGQRDSLAPAEQAVYDSILDGMLRMENVPGLQAVSSQRLFEIVELVNRDHPEIFWVGERYSCLEYPEGYTLIFDYSCTFEQRQSLQEQIESQISPLLQQLAGLSDYEKALGVYRWLILNTDYDLSADEQNILSVLLRHRGVCAGYAKATQYLLGRLGIECLYVTGTSRGEAHAWNVARLEGDWYQLDTTWGDPVNADWTAGDRLSYIYFCLTTREMELDHRPDAVVALPECSAVSCNYYVREGRLLAGYDRERIRQLLAEDLYAGSECSFRLSDGAAMEECRRILMDEGEIFPLLEEIGLGQRQVSYLTDQDHAVMTVICS